jgi:hypothetical protein
MFKLPAVIIYMIIAFNITAFTAILQMDMLIFKGTAIKVVFWILSIGAWYLAYLKRDKLWQIF